MISDFREGGLHMFLKIGESLCKEAFSIGRRKIKDKGEGMTQKIGYHLWTAPNPFLSPLYLGMMFHENGIEK